MCHSPVGIVEPRFEDRDCAIEFIDKKLIALRDAGKALLIVSVELDEILGLADRILVMNAGEIVGEVARADATEEKLGLMMAGVKEAHA